MASISTMEAKFSTVSAMVEVRFSLNRPLGVHPFFVLVSLSNAFSIALGDLARLRAALGWRGSSHCAGCPES